MIVFKYMYNMRDELGPLINEWANNELSHHDDAHTDTSYEDDRDDGNEEEIYSERDDGGNEEEIYSESEVYGSHISYEDDCDDVNEDGFEALVDFEESAGYDDFRFHEGLITEDCGEIPVRN